MRNKPRFCLLCLELVFFCVVGLAQPSKPSDVSGQNNSVLQELLGEVKLLRLALERSAVVSARTQVLVQRMQLQNQRVLQASQRFDETHKQIAKLLSDQATCTETLRNLQGNSSKEQDPNRKREMEREIEEEKRLLERLTFWEGQLRVQESEAEAALRKDQVVWDELSEQLAGLERSLALTPAQPALPTTKP